MAIKKYLKSQFKKIESEMCGELIEVIDGKDCPVSIVVGDPIDKTNGHYHSDSDEIYICSGGQITVELYDPKTVSKESVTLTKFETLYIEKGVHHKVVESSAEAILIAVSIPGWKKETEFISNIL